MKKHHRDLQGCYTKSPWKKIKQFLKLLFSLKSYYLFVTGTVLSVLAIGAYAAQLWLPHQVNKVLSTPKTSIVNPVVNLAHAQSIGTIREVTMYSSTPEQTDATPCIAANGQDICVLWAKSQNLCATNAFPFGTELEVDKLGSCLVVDRMNDRYSNRIDWYAGYDNDCLDGVDSGDYCPTYTRALNFGLQNLLVTVK